MKLTLPPLLALGALALLFHDPEPARAQSKEEKAIRVVQLDIYELQKRIDDLKAAQDGRIAEIERLLRQLAEANGKLAADQASLLETIRANQAEAQRRAYDPLAAIKINVEDASGDVAAVQAVLETMRKRQEAMEKSLYDLTAAVKLIPSTPPEPVSAAPLPPSAADSARLLFASAQADRLRGNLDFALAAFLDLSQKYPEAPEAPMSVYEMGMIYAGYEQYDDAVASFDRVLEQFGDNPLRKDAQFKKAEMLGKLGRRTDAAREYESYARQYPGDARSSVALDLAKAMRAPAPAAAKPNTSKSKSGKR